MGDNLRLLITGSSGFIGSHLCERLKTEDIPFKVFDGDICNERDVIRNLRNVDTVFHLAALPYVPPSFHSPEPYFETNTLGTINFIKNWDMFDRMIYVSTSHTYGNIMSKLGISEITEETPQSPIDPYSISKFAAERMVYVLGESGSKKYTILRPFNNYGPRHSKDYVIPKMVCQAITEDKITVNGDSMRDFTYVEDTVDAFIKILAASRLNYKVYNISSEKCYKISQIADYIFRLLDREPNVEVLEKSNRPLDIPLLHASSERIREELGWKPRFTLSEGLKKIIEYWGKELG
jgi:nucleoside-diphosphate-sugar epimerase